MTRGTALVFGELSLFGNTVVRSQLAEIGLGPGSGLILATVPAYSRHQDIVDSASDQTPADGLIHPAGVVFDKAMDVRKRSIIKAIFDGLYLDSIDAIIWSSERARLELGWILEEHPLSKPQYVYDNVGHKLHQVELAGV